MFDLMLSIMSAPVVLSFVAHSRGQIRPGSLSPVPGKENKKDPGSEAPGNAPHYSSMHSRKKRNLLTKVREELYTNIIG